MISKGLVTCSLGSYTVGIFSVSTLWIHVTPEANSIPIQRDPDPNSGAGRAEEQHTISNRPPTTIVEKIEDILIDKMEEENIVRYLLRALGYLLYSHQSSRANPYAC